MDRRKIEIRKVNKTWIKIEKINSPLTNLWWINDAISSPARSYCKIHRGSIEFASKYLDWLQAKRTGACRRPFASTPFAFDELGSTQRTIDDAIICHCISPPLCSLVCHVQKHATKERRGGGRKKNSLIFRKASPRDRQF